ncbi:hypothetical protein N431DRAFT_469357 [Stipitochalara longipes BDJ]|nr:hypothetical protein N431DRAFT_469357 [Stipitochalara longipes BDJ]
MPPSTPDADADAPKPSSPTAHCPLPTPSQKALHAVRWPSSSIRRQREERPPTSSLNRVSELPSPPLLLLAIPRRALYNRNASALSRLEPGSSFNHTVGSRAVLRSLPTIGLSAALLNLFSISCSKHQGKSSSSAGWHTVLQPLLQRRWSLEPGAWSQPAPAAAAAAAAASAAPAPAPASEPC